MMDLVISVKSSRDIMEDYFGFPLNTIVDVLEDIDDSELKFEVEKCGNELQVNFIGMERITSNMDFSLLYTHHKLNFENHKSKTCYFVNKLATILYFKYLFPWCGKVQFMIDNSRMNFSQVEETDIKQLYQEFIDQIDEAKSEKKSAKKPESM